MHKEVKKYLELLDTKIQPLKSHYGEYKIAQQIKKILQEDKNYTPTMEDIAEQMAFDFLPDYPDDQGGWGTYYGPRFVLSNAQGQMVEYPSVKKVTKEMLDYWKKRAFEAKNPILKVRYADLVIDFSPQIINQKANYKLYQLVIDESITICENLLMHPLDCKTKIKRALNLALEINDSERIQKVKDAIIKLENKIAEIDKPGLWGFAFKWLLLNFKKKVKLSKDEEELLLSKLEEILKKVKNDPYLTEHAVSLLAEYYADKRDENNLMRVLKILEDSFKKDKRINSEALLKINAFQQIYEIYSKYRDKGFKKAKLATERLSKEIGQLNIDWEKSLKRISVSVPVKKEEIEKFLNSIFGEEKRESFKKIVEKIVIKFLPKLKNVEKQFKEISKKHPLQFLCTTKIISEEGIPIAKLSDLESDYDKHLLRHFSQYLQLDSFLLSLTMDKFKEIFTSDQIFEYFQKCLLFEEENQNYLKRALEAFWNGDYLVSSHLFIPLIESAIRKLIKICGGVILILNEFGGYDYIPLSTLLKKQGEIIEKVFEPLGKEFLFYFRAVLTEKLGMNLRNNFAHGIGKGTFFSPEVSNRLFHLMLCLSLVHKKNEKV